MTQEGLAFCLSLLQGKFQMRSWKWTDVIEDIFREGLLPIEDDLAKAATWSLLYTQERPPDISEILRLAAEMASPFPAPATAWNEAWNAARQSGKLRFSHPLVQSAVVDLGGLDAIWHGYQSGKTALATLRGNFLSAYAARCETWLLDVMAEMRLPPAERDVALFPGYEQQASASVRIGRHTIESDDEKSAWRGGLPDDLRELTASVGRAMP